MTHPAPHRPPAVWKIPIMFLVHIAVGLVMFGAVAFAAVSLHIGVEWLEGKRVMWLIVGGVRGIEHLMFVTDGSLFVTFLLRTSIDHGKLIWQTKSQ
jgi:hypothetical protein